MKANALLIFFFSFFFFFFESYFKTRSSSPFGVKVEEDGLEVFSPLFFLSIPDDCPPSPLFFLFRQG